MKTRLFNILICVLFILIFLLVSNITYGFFKLGDDTYIYLQYARSIIERGEISFNPGEPTYGFTSPLWLLLITIMVKITGSFLSSPHQLTLIFSVSTIIIWWIILWNSDLKPMFKYLVLLAISLDPNLLKHSYLGMEASASFFLSSLLVYILINFNSKNLTIYLGILFGIYYLIRPESIIIYLVLISFLFISHKIFAKDILLMLLTSTMIVLPWIIFSLVYFGSFLPTTFYAKGASYGLGGKFFTHLFDSMKIIIGNYLLIIIATFIAIIFPAFKKMLSKNKHILLFIVFSFSGLIIFYSLTLNREVVYARYYCMIFPLIYWFLIVLLSESFIKTKYFNYYLCLVILYSIIVTIIFSNLTKRIYKDEVIETKVATWVRKNTNPDDIVVRARIGKIGFLGGRKILDPMGIINPDIIEYQKTNSVTEYYAKHKPKYFIGTFNFDKFKNYAKVEKILEFKGIQSNLPRHIVLGDIKYSTIPIYMINWYNDYKK